MMLTTSLLKSSRAFVWCMCLDFLQDVIGSAFLTNTGCAKLCNNDIPCDRALLAKNWIAYRYALQNVEWLPTDAVSGAILDVALGRR